MKATILISILSAALLLSLLKAERSRESFGPRVPPVTIGKALEQLSLHLRDKGEADYFIDEAAFIRKEENSFWKFGIRNAERETGHAFYSVGIDGSVKIHSVVKDG